MASEAELRLSLAVSEVLAERGFIEDGMALGDFMVMTEITGWSDDMRGKTKYANLIPGDDGIPLHRLVGLSHVCTEILEEGEDE